MGITVPRITINAEYDDERSFGELRPLSVGYGLHQAWIFAAMFGAANIFGVNPLVEAGQGATSITFITSIVIYSIVLLASAANDQKFLDVFVSRKTGVAAAAIMSLGTLILLAPLEPGVPDAAMQVASGCLTGIGSALLILMWGTAFARQEQSTIVINTAVAIAIGVAVYAIVLHHLPFPVCGVLAGLLPVLELPFLLKETPRPFTERDDRPIFQPLPINRGKFLAKFGIPVAVFGIALGALRQTSIQTILPAATGPEQILAVLASCCALVLVLVTLLALKSANGWNRLFRPLVPFVAVVAFFFPVAGMNEPTISGFALLVGYMSFEAMLWICFGELSQQYRLSPVFVFGIGRGMQAATTLAGSLIPIFAVAWADFLPMGSSTVIVILLLAMVVAYALLPGRTEIQELVINCPLTKLVESGEFDRYEAVAKSVVDGVPAGQLSAGTDGAAGSFAVEATPAEVAGAEAPSAALPTDGAATVPTAPPERADGTAASDAQDEPAASDRTAAPAAAATVAQTAASVPATANAASGKQADGLWPTEKRGRFKRKCEATANRYLLSARETEVLFFLAKGHNATSIQEQLFISEGTTKTHIRHIYRKLDVHSQQELIQIVENADVE